jgi:hypothetical protein
MYDLKPEAPAEIRGEFKPIDSNVPGIRVCEHLPLLAKWMHKAAIVRSVNHKAGCHNPAASYTGYPEPVERQLDTLPPCMGSVCEYLKPAGNDLPACVHMPCYHGWGRNYRYAGPYGGFLGKRYDPLFSECSPTSDKPAAGLHLPELARGVPRLPTGTLPEGITLDRLNKRRDLAEQFDDQLRGLEKDADYVSAQRRAYSLLTSRRLRDAFDLNTVPLALRQRYGNTLFGSCALVARRLVEEGVRFTVASWDTFWEHPSKIDAAGWDTHEHNFKTYRTMHLPQFDLTAAALLEDLDQRGLLDETLVVVLSEMGRTPKINGNAGRDHWTFCYSTLLAGAGIKGGTVYGASDAHASYVKENPVSPADICATIYHCLGIDPDLELHDASGRPVSIAQGGRPIQAILS